MCVLRRPIIIPHTSWRPVGVWINLHSSSSSSSGSALSAIAQLRAADPPALRRHWEAQSLREQVIPLSAGVHGSIALSLSVSWQSWWDWSAPANLSSPFPRILPAHSIPGSLAAVCTCASPSALCSPLIDPNEAAICVIQDGPGALFVQIYVACLR